MYATRIYKTAAIILAAVMLLSMAACSGGKVEHTPTPGFFYQNNLQINVKNEYSSDNDDISCTYFTISGMKDEKVQNSINEELERCYKELVNLEKIPEYRGMKLKMEGIGEPSSMYISIYAVYNLNNILSCSASQSVWFEGASEDENGFSFSQNIGMTFDLNTGKKLSLGDVFTKGFDYKSYLDEYVEKKLIDHNAADESDYDYYDIGLVQVSPFTGVKDDQNFYLTEFSGDVVLLFGAEFPEFNTEYSTASINVPVCDEMSHYSDYLSDTSLFTDECVNKFLYTRSDKLNIKEYTNESEAPEFAHGMLTRDLALGYADDTPEQMKNDAKAIYESRTGLGDIDEQMYKKHIKDYREGQLQCYTMYSVSCEEFCGYPYIGVSAQFSLMDIESYTTIEDYFYDVNIPYSRDGSRRLELKDLFVDGADYDKLLYDAMLKSARTNLEQMSLSEEGLEEYVRAMLDNVEGFTLQNDMMYLSIPKAVELARQYYGSSDDMYSYAYCCNACYYKDLGCDNLNIFD